MNLKCTTLSLALLLCVTTTHGSQDALDESIQSRVIKAESGDLILAQEFVVEAAISDVWKAHVTEEGWMSWSAPLAEIDFRAGGTIRTHYGTNAKIGDPGTITLHIVNYVPERVLTLRAELSERWPDVMKEDEGNLMTVIVFDSLGEKRTRVSCYGVGYRDLPAYDKLMEFFIPANEGLFLKLKNQLEK